MNSLPSPVDRVHGVLSVSVSALRDLLGTGIPCGAVLPARRLSIACLKRSLSWKLSNERYKDAATATEDKASPPMDPTVAKKAVFGKDHGGFLLNRAYQAAAPAPP
jgi:hypothetical protein